MAQEANMKNILSKWQNICPTLLSIVESTMREEREKKTRKEVPIHPEPIPAHTPPISEIPFDKTWEEFCPPIIPTEQPASLTPQQQIMHDDLEMFSIIKNNISNDRNECNSDLFEIPPDLEFCLETKLFYEH